MEYLTRGSDVTHAMTTVRVQKDRLEQQLVELRKWQIDTRVEVVQPTLELKITVQKLDGSGFIKTFTKEEALYHERDIGTLINMIIELIVERLIKPVLIGELSLAVGHAVQNIAKIERTTK